MKIAIIGFGEAGHMFGKGLSAQADVFAYDMNITPEMQLNAEAAHVSLSRDLSAALKDAQIVFSLVTADQAQCAARAAAPLLKGGQVYFEMNSIAPDTKRSNADLIPSLVDAAIMAPVYPQERAAEMREAAKTVKNAKIPTQISFEIAKAHDIYHGILKSQ